jgi:hypothetical protein
LPGIASGDIGKCVHGVFQRGREFINQTIGIAAEHLTGTEMAHHFARRLGQPVHYNAITPEEYRGLGFPGAQDLGNMFQFKRDFEEYFCGARNLEFSRSINPALQTFEAWLAANQVRIPLG